jgi:hypothetical protein
MDSYVDLDNFNVEFVVIDGNRYRAAFQHPTGQPREELCNEIF